MSSRVSRVLESYRLSEIRIGTIGSHSALNIFKGARDEGFKTVCICRERDAIIYERFKLADEYIFVRDYSDLLDSVVQEKLKKLNTILIPHGSFNAYISSDELMEELEVPIFGNRQLLAWETSRERQEEWLRMAKLNLPRSFKSPEEIDGLTIVKFPGARGGKGYFIVNSADDFYEKTEDMLKRGLITREDLDNVHLQEYVVGVNIYPHYFKSLIRGVVELLGFDRRYESTVDGLGRIPSDVQVKANISLTYTVAGNIPLTVRESLLSEYLRMGDRVAEASVKIAPPGIIGPFCLETIVTEDLKIYCFEISARIVAGTNVGIGSSPYAYLLYGDNMYMGRRIAREIKEAIRVKCLDRIVT